MKTFIAVAAPDIGQEEIDEVVDSLRSGWITTGPKVQRFEAELAAYTGAREVVALSSCTAALHLSLLALGIGPGDEVVTTPLTFVSAVNTIVHAGATPVLADVDPVTLGPSPESVASRITPRTRAIQALHYAGQPCDLEALHAIAARHGLPVVEDAAHAMGSSLGGRRIGSHSPLVCFSFYATKNLATAEGGALAVNDPRHAETVRRAALHGMSRDAWKRYSAAGSWQYDVVMPGYKYNMTDLQAALGIHQLRKLEAGNARRDAIAALYEELFADNAAVRPMRALPGRRWARHLFVVRVDPRRSALSRDALSAALREEQVGTTVNFIPVYRFSAYRGRFRAEDTPTCEALADELLTLPLHVRLSDDDVRRVAEAVNRLTGAK